jgi:acyl-coenzyme A thioesterase PaaI-like protein
MSDIDLAEVLPSDHVQFELDGDIAFTEDGTTTGRLRPAGSQRTPTGAVPMGLVANFADLLAGWASLRRAAPDRVATADMTISLLPMARPEHLDGEVSVVRKGRSTMVSEVTIRDDRGVTVGLATATFTVLPQPPHVSPPSVLPPGRHALTRDRREPMGSFSASSGVVVDGPGRTSVAIAPRVHNALRALNGGVIAALVDDAVASAGSAALGRPCLTADLDIAYLSLGRVGPARAIATVLGAPLPAGTDRATVEVEVVDEGAGDRLLTRASGLAVIT